VKIPFSGASYGARGWLVSGVLREARRELRGVRPKGGGACRHHPGKAVFIEETLESSPKLAPGPGDSVTGGRNFQARSCNSKPRICDSKLRSCNSEARLRKTLLRSCNSGLWTYNSGLRSCDSEAWSCDSEARSCDPRGGSCNSGLGLCPTRVELRATSLRLCVTGGNESPSNLRVESWLRAPSHGRIFI